MMEKKRLKIGCVHNSVGPGSGHFYSWLMIGLLTSVGLGCDTKRYKKESYIRNKKQKREIERCDE